MLDPDPYVISHDCIVLKLFKMLSEAKIPFSGHFIAKKQMRLVFIFKKIKCATRFKGGSDNLMTFFPFSMLYCLLCYHYQNKVLVKQVTVTKIICLSFLFLLIEFSLQLNRYLQCSPIFSNAVKQSAIKIQKAGM